MTDAHSLQVQMALPATLLALEIWGDAWAVERRLGLSLPPVGQALQTERCRILWWEPRTWLVRTPEADRQAHVEALSLAAGTDGAVTDISGGFKRHRLEGEGWRGLLMVGGVFDAESSAFVIGSVAGTVIHHMPVRLDVLSETVVEVYIPPSYCDDLLDHWQQAIPRLTSA